MSSAMVLGMTGGFTLSDSGVQAVHSVSAVEGKRSSARGPAPLIVQDYIPGLCFLCFLHVLDFLSAFTAWGFLLVLDLVSVYTKGESLQVFDLVTAYMLKYLYSDSSHSSPSTTVVILVLGEIILP